MFNALKAPFEVGSKISWDEYPRPLLKRDSYISLCGKWELILLKNEKETPLGSITVPYPPESRISGIERQLGTDEKYIYRRSFSLPDGFNKGKVLLHFGAADQIARIFINGKFVCENIGGYLPFCADITAFLEDTNTIHVEITDTLDTDIPCGKQRKKRGGMWYTPISGIWQSVWLESVRENYIENIKITPTLDSVKIEVFGGEDEKEITVFANDKELKHTFKGKETVIKIENPINWSPENPHLYSFTLKSGEDKIDSYFALRTISKVEKNGKAFIALNGKPYFFHGILDQGYFSDGIYTPTSPEGYIFDILTMKSLGFNTLRKHIKIEPDLFYYYCDKYGMIVFQDMVNNGKYSFLIDTALPTIGLKRGITHRASEKRKQLFEEGCKSTLSHLYNHPSVCYYTIFNEGWGQYDANRIYKELSALDSSRIFDSTSGWFFEACSDVESHHIYFKKLKFKKGYTRPLILSEFGGYSSKILEHSFNTSSTFGYSKNLTTKEFENALIELYDKQIIPAIKENALCGTILTQLSDVEDETNGLVTFDRQIVKVSKEKMMPLANRLFDTFSEITK
ncbi:MAG: glycoside hydrolase family 2 [Clostridia bacterium]|nr:glycoside hydrolase family 2 [Clostridia bacterium]